MEIGKNIKAFRLANNMEQKDLAEKLHISNKTVSSWERGRTEPNIGMLESIAEVLNTTKSDLIEGNMPAAYAVSQDSNNSIIIQSEKQNPTDTQVRLFSYVDKLSKEGIEKLIERAIELEKIGYGKDGD